MIWPIIKAMRPKQWLKNGFVLAALIFVRAFNDANAVLLALGAVICFCLAASSVYIFNDIVDVAQDRLHTTKKNRPIASGQISLLMAYFISGLLGGLALVGAWFVSQGFLGIISVYLIIQVLYSLWLKKKIIIDVMIIALGFVLRVVGGAVAIGVAFSPWLIFCTFFLTLFLAITKRRGELNSELGTETRAVLNQYTPAFLESMNTIVLPLTLITYTFYTFSSEHTVLLITTVPLVLYGLFRYQFLTGLHPEANDGPTDLVWQDRPLQFTILLWVILSAGIIWFIH